ncbi:DNA repair exonuclease [Cytobacillus sp. IB215316]|uniref:metallophosphoesterase family protein n=1 Tax=Cytobacillus sp. IB215316 TaxID=3097354 RepID=UPI002A0C8859|nr:DNA repair exonuclease [Cytobacillus sp. IB215316]MDX8361237.1 DNA repair exonuclease [Cytobacillus sp. IB215316]
MEQIKFLHAADLHLDSPFVGLKKLPTQIFQRVMDSTFIALTNLVDIAIKEQVDFVILAGDIYDQEDRSIRAQARLRKEMERLKKAQIEVYIVHGNHDYTNGSWIDITWPENVHIFSDETVECKTYKKEGKELVNLYGFSYRNRSVRNNMTDLYNKQGEVKFHIGILHGSSEGQTEHNNYAPFTVRQLIEKDFDYWALGHIHQRQVLCDNPPIIYPGNTQGRHRKEHGEKGCYLVNLATTDVSYSFHPTTNLIWDQLEINIAQLETFEELLNVSYTKFEEIRSRNNGTLLSIEFIGSGPLHKVLQNEAQLEDFLSIIVDGEEERQDFIWVDKTIVNTSEGIEDKNIAQSPFLKDLVTMISEFEEYEEVLKPLFSHSQARKYLTEFSEEDIREIHNEAQKLLFRELY